MGPEWHARTPREVLDGCFVVPGARPIWAAFARLSRGRDVGLMGSPRPLSTRDIRDAAASVRCELPAETVEALLMRLDDAFLEHIARGDSRKRNH